MIKQDRTGQNRKEQDRAGQNRIKKKEQEKNNLYLRTMTPVMASLAEVLRSSTDYSPCYPWFVRLAKNFHNIQENRDYENCYFLRRKCKYYIFIKNKLIPEIPFQI